MEANAPHKPRRAKRAWITEETLEMVEHRRALAAAGLIGDARALDKLIKAGAREDKRAWIERGLQEKCWEPKQGCHPYARGPGGGAGAIAPPEPGKAVANTADIYAEHLGKVQWGAGERNAAQNAGWGTTPAPGAARDIPEQEFTMEGLAGALSKSARGRAPGVDGIPAELWVGLGVGRRTLLDFINRCWNEETFPAQWREATVVGIFKKWQSR